MHARPYPMWYSWLGVRNVYVNPSITDERGYNKIQIPYKVERRSIPTGLRYTNSGPLMSFPESNDLKIVVSRQHNSLLRFHRAKQRMGLRRHHESLAPNPWPGN